VDVEVAGDALRRRFGSREALMSTRNQRPAPCGMMRFSMRKPSISPLAMRSSPSLGVEIVGVRVASAHNS
jgi:hypothetical protein